MVMNTSRPNNEWFLQSDGSADFTRPGVKSGHGRVTERPGIALTSGGHPVYSGRNFLECGSISAYWMYPSGLVFYDGSPKPRDPGFEIAPTGWRNIQDINVRDNRLTWYRWIPGLRDIRIPVDALPGSRITDDDRGERSTCSATIDPGPIDSKPS